MKSSPTSIMAVFLSLGIMLALAYRVNDATLKTAPSPTESPAREVKAPKDQIVVEVVGAVHRPGVYTLPLGSRAVDAVKAAGGLTDQANQMGVNLAAKIHDEQMVKVPAIGEPLTAETPLTDDTGTPAPDLDDGLPNSDLTPAADVTSEPRKHKKKASATGSPSASPSAAPLPDVARVSLNRASLKELQGVPGLTPDMAAAIISYRKGPPPHAFTSIEDLELVTGLKGTDVHLLLPYLKL